MTPRTKLLKLPNMNEFSPGVIGALRPVLILVSSNAGNRARQIEAIEVSAKKIAKTPVPQRAKRANNVLIGMSECGLYDLRQHSLTPLGQELATVSSDSEVAARFAKHILLNCRGDQLLDAVRSIQKRSERISLDSIRRELRVRGFAVTTNEGNASKLRAWMEPSFVVDRDWIIDEDRFRQLTGLDAAVKTEWTRLSGSQRAFLATVHRLAAGTDRWIDGSHARELCVAERGPEALPEGALRARVLDPLEEGGWIGTEGKGAGRGGKIGRVHATAKLLGIPQPGDLPIPSTRIPPELLAKLDTPLEDIYRGLESAATHDKGIALELLTLRICTDLGLRPVAFRKRGIATGGAEVDLIAEGIHLHYSRWLFQCKNVAGAVDVEDLAKEIGMAVLLRAHVVVMVTTGRFAHSVGPHADQVGIQTPLQVVLIDSKLLKSFRTEGAGRLIDALRNQASNALELKSPQVEPVLKPEGF